MIWNQTFPCQTYILSSISCLKIFFLGGGVNPYPLVVMYNTCTILYSQVHILEKKLAHLIKQGFLRLNAMQPDLFLLLASSASE